MEAPLEYRTFLYYCNFNPKNAKNIEIVDYIINLMAVYIYFFHFL